MKPYEKYKDSGVEWIGDIPNHWDIAGFKRYIDKIVDYRGKTPLKVEEGIFLVTTRNIKNGKIDYSLSQEYVNEDDYKNIMSRGIPQVGDVLFTMEAPLGEVANVVDTNIALAQRIIKLTANENKLNNYYLKYWIQSSVFQQNLYTHATGSTALGIKSSKLHQLKIILPSLEEQICIVEYLDQKISHIDNILNKKEELIKMLNISREKLISETVIRGLNKDIEIKDSEVKYIGEIPSHYEVLKLKNICENIGRGKSPEYEENTGVYTVNQACLYWNYFKSESLKPVSQKFYNKLGKNHKIRKGDILINSTGGGNLGKSAFFDKTGTLGRVHFYEGDENYAYDSHVTMVRLNKEYNHKYFYYLFCTRNFHNYIDLFCVNGSTKQIELSKTSLESVLVAVPGKEEQDKIVKYLDNKTFKIDEIVSLIKEQIDVLKKAKEKLITEVVTGKIDVRDYK